MHPPVIAYRRLVPADERFVAAVYASSREEELRAAGMTGAAKDAFLRQQLQAQTLDWARTYPRASREIVLVDGRPAGRLYIDRDAGLRRLHVIDITLLGEFRGRGVGTEIFRRLFTEADELGWAVSLQADPSGRAYRFYLERGFAPVRRNGFRVVMHRAPAVTAGAGGANFVRGTEPSTQG